MMLLSRRLIASLIVAGLTTTAVADTIVTVRVASGRQFQGQVDSSTDRHVLWLRSGTPESFVRRPIAWDRVVSIVVGEKQLTVEEFRQLIASPDWQWTSNPLDELPAPSSSKSNEIAPEDVTPTHQVGYWDPVEASHDVPPPVVAMHIEAYVANWDSDVEVDGLVVHVYPLDETGATVPALATLEVDLIGQGYTNLAEGNPFPLLGRWSEVVRCEDVGTNGAIFRLPFQWVHPDFNNRRWDVASYGMVHGRLSVAGSGVFEDTAAFTRIRPYSPVRDRMQQIRGTRFHPWELTSQGYW